VWQEKLNEDETEYFVDGEWRKLDIIEEVIKIKGQPDLILKVKNTHRGPVMGHEILRTNSALLFGGSAGRIEMPQQYSFAWSGQYAGDDTFSLLRALYDSNDIKELYSKLDNDLGKDYRGLGQNFLFADTSGNIGYRLIMSIPERKDRTPFISSRILDGTTSSFDWTGEIIHQRDMPRSLNPKKGFIVTANQR